MYGINLQLFNSKLRISIFDNFPKKLHFRKTCGFAKLRKKKLPKTKIPFHEQLSEKIFPVLRKLRKKNSAKPRKTHCVSCAKVRKKKFCAKIAQILRKRFSHFVETLIVNDKFSDRK